MKVSKSKGKRVLQLVGSASCGVASLLWYALSQSKYSMKGALAFSICTAGAGVYMFNEALELEEDV